MSDEALVVEYLLSSSFVCGTFKSPVFMISNAGTTKATFLSLFCAIDDDDGEDGDYMRTSRREIGRP